MGYLEYLSLLVLLLLFSRDGACAPISANPTETVAEIETQTTSSSTNTSIFTTSQSFTSTASDPSLSQDMGLSIIPSINSIISGIIGGGSENTSPSQSQTNSAPPTVPSPTDTAEDDNDNTSPSQSPDGNGAEDATPSSSSSSSGPSNSPTNFDTPNISEESIESPAGSSNGNNVATITTTLSNGNVVQVFRTQTDGTSLLSIQTSIASETGEQKESSSNSAGSTAGAVIGTLAGISLLILIILIWRRKVRSGSGPLAYFSSQKYHKSSQNSVDEKGNVDEKAEDGNAQNWTDFPRSPNSAMSNNLNLNSNSNSIDSHYLPPPTGSNQSHQSAGSRLMILTQPPSPFAATDDGMYSPDPFRSKF